MGFAETFKALSNPIRRDILDLLKLGQLSAGEISSHFELAGATISHHLSVLKKADLVRETREKNFICLFRLFLLVTAAKNDSDAF